MSITFESAPVTVIMPLRAAQENLGHLRTGEVTRLASRGTFGL